MAVALSSCKEYTAATGFLTSKKLKDLADSLKLAWMNAMDECTAMTSCDFPNPTAL